MYTVTKVSHRWGIKIVAAAVATSTVVLKTGAVVPDAIAVAPAYFHLAAFIIISTLQLFSAQREQPVMVCFTVKYHKINHFLQFFIRTLPSLIFNLFTEKTTTGRDCMSDFN